MKHELAQICAQVREARDAGTQLAIVGGNTKSFYGEPNTKTGTLTIRPYCGVINYEPSELVITARAGTPLADIEHTLSEQGQMLAFEPPRFGPAATIGGVVASGLSGPRRMAVGRLGDFVLGARLLDSQATLLSFGGEVMKNVAGYDVSRLLAGSLGSLGPLVEVSLKVLPKPQAEASVRLHVDESQALTLFNQWRSQPLPISATAWEPALGDEEGGFLYVRLSGSKPALQSAYEHIGGDRMDEESASALWASLRDQTHPFFEQRPLWRVALPPTTKALELGPTLIEWGGGQRWLRTPIPADELRQKVASLGGHATLYRYENVPAGVTIFHPMSPALERINRRMMAQLDKSGIFQPGRLLPAIEG